MDRVIRMGHDLTMSKHHYKFLQNMVTYFYVCLRCVFILTCIVRSIGDSEDDFKSKSWLSTKNLN